MADVPLGAFLSGGIDSTAVAALMAREMDRPVQTFSVAFADRAFSELEYARQAAHAIGADSHEIVMSDDDFFGALPRLIWHEDEPIAHPSSVPLHFVSALARQHVKVGPHRRRQRRAARRIRQVSARAAQLERCRLYERWVPRAVRSACGFVSRSETSRPHRPDGAPIVPRVAAEPGGYVFRQLRRDPAERSARAAPPVADEWRCVYALARILPPRERQERRCSIVCSTPT